MGENATRFINFSKPFIGALKNIFEMMIFTKIEAQKPFLKKSNETTGDISAVIGIVGESTFENQVKEFKGMLVLSWPEDCYIKIANAMLMEDHKEFNQEISDAGAEIAN